jgi:hypothetical protein
MFSHKSYFLCISNNEIVQNSKSKQNKFSFLCIFNKPTYQVRGDLPGQHPEVLLVDDGEAAGQGAPGHTQGGRTLHIQGIRQHTLIKKKIKYFYIKGNSYGSGCKVIYEEGLPNI